MQNKTRSPGKNSFLSSFAFHFASIVISLAALVYLGYHFVNSFSNDIETEYALQITESDVISLDAYIIRDEQIVYSTEPGSKRYLFADGEKVKSGTTVANIYSGSQSAEDSELISIDKQLELLSASGFTEGISSSDAKAIDNRISDSYYTIRRNAELGEYSTLPKRRDELLTLLNKRRLVTGAVESYDPLIEDLKAQRDSMTELHGSIAESVAAPSSGYFYSELDGFEEIFLPSAVPAMNYESFDAMLSSEPKSYGDLAVGKLCTRFEWYAVAECSRDSLRHFTTGQKYTVTFPYNNDESITMELVNLYAEVGSERVLVVLKASTVPEDFSFRRMQPIEIVRSSYTGYKIPISATRMLDGEVGVYILYGNMVQFRRIDILLELDGYYIVAPRDPEKDPDYKDKLALYDSVIISGKGLYEGKMIS